jgi:hypothetical protein
MSSAVYYIPSNLDMVSHYERSQAPISYIYYTAGLLRVEMIGGPEHEIPFLAWRGSVQTSVVLL